jgi:hypothetical protein
MAAPRLADFAGLDVDAFNDFVVQALHEYGTRGRALAHALETPDAPVIPIKDEYRRRDHGERQGEEAGRGRFDTTRTASPRSSASSAGFPPRSSCGCSLSPLF